MSCCGKAAKGIAGLTKAALGIDRADPATIESRRDICRGCEFATRNPKFADSKGLTSFSRCLKCSCLIAAKTNLVNESCPLAKWDAQTKHK